MSSDSERRVVIYLFLIYSSFIVVGILLGFWFGLGWLLLLHTFRGFFASIPQIYLPTIRWLGGSEPVDADREPTKGRSVFLSRSSMITNAVNVVLTILVFWKMNVPIQSILERLGR